MFTHVCMYVCVHTCVCSCICAWLCMCVYVHVITCVLTHVFMCMCACMHIVCVHAHVCMCVCVCSCMCACLYCMGVRVVVDCLNKHIHAPQVFPNIYSHYLCIMKLGSHNRWDIGQPHSWMKHFQTWEQPYKVDGGSREGLSSSPGRVS